MSSPDLSPLEEFRQRASKMPSPSVLEIGTRRTSTNRSTLRKDWVPHAREYIAADFREGLDVDVVADAHHLSDVLGENRFDLVISCSTYEHIQNPWLATVEICRVLKPGGVVFVQTHQSFPIHAHPHDYWRFTADGLKTLFSQHIGFLTIAAGHEFPCRIVSERDAEAANLPSFLNTCILAEKIHHPARDRAYVPELETLVQEKQLLQKAMDEKDEQIRYLAGELRGIQESLGWLLLCGYGRVRNRCLPSGSRRRAFYELVMSRLKLTFGSVTQ